MKDNCSGVRNSSYVVAKKKFKHHIRMTSSLVSQRSWVPVPLKPEYFSGSVSQPLQVVLCNRDDLSFVIFFCQPNDCLATVFPCKHVISEHNTLKIKRDTNR